MIIPKPSNIKNISTLIVAITLIFTLTLSCRSRLALASNGKLKRQAIAIGAIKNGVQGGNNMPLITLEEVYNWAGRFVINASVGIDRFFPSAFLHQGVANHPKGSKAAVVYSQRSLDPQKGGVVHTWILAWSIPTFPSVYNQNQVYVAAGGIIPRVESGEIDWRVIERRLASSSDTTDAYDNISETEAIAVISYSEFGSIHAQFLTCIFGQKQNHQSAKKTIKEKMQGRLLGVGDSNGEVSKDKYKTNSTNFRHSTETQGFAIFRARL